MSLASKVYYHIDCVYNILRKELSTKFPSIMKEIAGYYAQFKLIQGVKDRLILDTIKPYFIKYATEINRETPLTVMEIFELITAAVMEKKDTESINILERYSVLSKSNINQEQINVMTQHIKIVYNLLK